MLVTFESAVENLGLKMAYQSLGRKMPLPAFEAFVSCFPPTHEGEICCSSLQGSMGLVRQLSSVRKLSRYRSFNVHCKSINRRSYYCCRPLHYAFGIFFIFYELFEALNLLLDKLLLFSSAYYRQKNNT